MKRKKLEMQMELEKVKRAREQRELAVFRCEF